MIEYKQGIAALVPVRLLTSAGVPVTGIAFGSATCTVEKASGATSSVTVDGSNWLEITTGAFNGAGKYDLTLPLTVMDVTGPLFYAVKCSTAQYVGLIKVVANEEVDTYTRIGAPVLASVAADVQARPTNPLITTDVRLNNLDATISSRSTFAGGAVASVSGAVGSVTGSVGSVTGLTVPLVAAAVWDEALAGHVTAGTAGIKLSNTASTAEINALATVYDFHADSYVLDIGTVISGSLNDTFTREGVPFVLGELTTPSPFLQATFAFSTDKDFISNEIQLWGHYDGGSASTHWVDTLAFNYITSTWELLSTSANHLHNDGADALYSYKLSQDHCEFATGNIQIRLQHSASPSGNLSHRLYIDKLAVLKTKLQPSLTVAEIEASTILAKEASVIARPTNPLLDTDVRLNNLDATISSRSTYAGGAVASVTGSVGSVVGLDASKLDATITSRAAAATAVSSADLTPTRAAFLDRLNVTGNVASSAEVNAIQNNTSTRIAMPSVFERPAVGSALNLINLYVYDSVGNMEDADSIPTLTVVNGAGTDRSDHLSNGGILTRIAVGHYHIGYTVQATDPIEQLIFEFTVIVLGATRIAGTSVSIFDEAVVQFSATDRSNVIAIKAVTDVLPTNPVLTTDARLNNLDATISSRSTFAGGAVASVTGSVGSVVGLTASNLDAAISSRAAAATAVNSADLTPGRAALLDNLNATVSSRSTFSGGAVASVTGSVGSVVGLDATKLDASVTSRLASTDARLNNLDATISSRSTYAGGAVASVTGTVGSVTGLNPALLDVAISTRSTLGGVAQTGDSFARLGAPTLASISADIAKVDADVLGGSAPSAATIASAVWNEALAGHTTAGTSGKQLSDVALDGTVAKAATALSTATWTAPRASSLDNLDATVSSRSTFAGGAVASVTGSVGAVTGLDPSRLDVAVSSRSVPGDGLSAGQNTVLNSIKTDTARVRAISEGRWKLDAAAKQLILYDTDGVTVIRRFSTVDRNGNPSVNEVFERIPI